jgi:hypothetical protein
MEAKIEQGGDQNLSTCTNGSFDEHQGVGTRYPFLYAILMDSVEFRC